MNIPCPFQNDCYPLNEGCYQLPLEENIGISIMVCGSSSVRINPSSDTQHFSFTINSCVAVDGRYIKLLERMFSIPGSLHR